MGNLTNSSTRKANRQKIAFACELGLFGWCRMLFGVRNASAFFQRAKARAPQKTVNREGSMVMAYIVDVVFATETIEDHMERLREVFQCLRQAGFKMRVSEYCFLKPEFKDLGHIVSAEGIKQYPKAVSELRDGDNPRTRTEWRSFLALSNYYRDFVPWHAKWLPPYMRSLALALHFCGGRSNNKLSTESIWLIEATALAQPDSEGEFVLD